MEGVAPETVVAGVEAALGTVVVGVEAAGTVVEELVLETRDEYSVRVPAASCRLSFFKIWPFSAEFHITHM